MPSLIGNKINQVPTNGDLGTLAFQDSNAVNITGGTVDVSAGTAALPTLGTTGDPNTGVFFPAADTVAVATNGAERVRVDSNGNLGIGTTSPAQKLDVNGNIKVGTNLWIGNSAGASYVADDGVFGGTIFNGGGFRIYTAAVERMRIDINGNLLVGLTSAVSGGAKLQTVDGITFPATQVASANANTLDDYEEGTWTPSLGGTATYNSQVGTYTKIGRQVTVNFVLDVSAIGTGSASIISGLPFIVFSSNRGAGSVGYVVSPVTAWTSIYPTALSGFSTIIFMTSSTLGAWTNTANVFGTGTVISGTATYFV